MPLERHAITAPARRTTFWPSIASVSAQLDARRLLRAERQPADDAVAPKLVTPALIGSRDAVGGAR